MSARRVAWRIGGLVVLLGFVIFLIVVPLTSIDWDIAQRRNQKSTFLRLRTLSLALTSFQKQHGGYPKTLNELHDTFLNVPNEYDRDYAEFSWNMIVDPSHAWGYAYEYIPDTVETSSQLPAHYALRAAPVQRGKTGFRSFYVSDQSSIRWNDERAATGSDPEPEIDPVLDLHSYWKEHFFRR